MRIYLAGNGAMPKQQRVDIYISKNLMKTRLFSYWEIRPGRFAHTQFNFVMKHLGKEWEYIASSAPQELKECPIYKTQSRLLSYYHIIHKQFQCDKVFKQISDENISRSNSTRQWIPERERNAPDPKQVA